MTFLLKKNNNDFDVFDDGDDYIKIHDKYVGTPNHGSDDENYLVKDGVKYFKHFSGALCTISQHHEG